MSLKQTANEKKLVLSFLVFFTDTCSNVLTDGFGDHYLVPYKWDEHCECL